MLLVFDEVQVGLGRTGSLWAHLQYGVEPDLMTLAKSLGGGLPIGVALLRQKVADCVKPGDHAATFGANPVSCAVALTVFDKLIAPGFMAGVKERSDHFHARLRKLVERWPGQLKEVRGRGLIVGVVTEKPASEYLAAFRQRHVLVASAGPDVVRFLPPLVTDKGHLDEVVDIFDEILRQA
jgi:acetylornithine/succinyldiaminopimelate/putrescine aminotransferase